MPETTVVGDGLELLADVVGALPTALKAEAIETYTLVPGYPAVMKAIETVLASPRAPLTPDLGGAATTRDLGDAIVSALQLQGRPASLRQT